MKTGFKDPIAIRKQDPEDGPKDGVKTNWDFRCPQYDERSSCFVNAGTNYGIGHRTPVGSEKHKNKYAIPVGRRNTLETDEVA